MSDTRVRAAGVDDIPTLVSLMAEFYAEADYPLDAGAATRAFGALLGDARNGGAWLLAEGGETVGYVVLAIGFGMEFGGLRGFVDDLFVRPSARRRGLAAAGLTAVRDACIARGLRALAVEVGSRDERALRLYTRHGFENKGHLLLTMPLAEPVHSA